MLSYPAKILKDGDFFLVSFRDFYHEEPVTQGGLCTAFLHVE